MSATKTVDGAFLRRLAHWGASRGPEWWVRYSPPPFGWVAAVALPEARRAVRRNLRRIRGEGSALRDTREVLATFGAYASCLAEVLSNDAPGGPRKPEACVRGELHLRAALRVGRGLILATAHTAGWEIVGPLLGRDHGLPMTMVMLPEPDRDARQLQDNARRAAGLGIVHVDDPLAALPLLRQLRAGGVVALQLDRVAKGMRTRQVRILGEQGVIPEGPLQLARLTGAPIVPVFSARTGHRRYLIETFEPRLVSRTADDQELDDVAAHLASSMTRFLRAHPTQWFQFAGNS